MKVEKTKIQGLLIIYPDIFEDQRGYFFESYNRDKYIKAGIENAFVQDNQSQSEYGVVRGLHMQKAPFEQAKLVRVIEGSIYDVAVDLRPESESFGKWFGIELSAINKKQLLIPGGFCHGFSVLSPRATVFYKCDQLYHPESEVGIRFDDPDLNINWNIPPDQVKLSNKDSQLPYFKDIQSF